MSDDVAAGILLPVAARGMAAFDVEPLRSEAALSAESQLSMFQSPDLLIEEIVASHGQQSTISIFRLNIASVLAVEQIAILPCSQEE